MIPPQQFRMRLASKDKVSANVYLVWFSLVEPKEITFIPGQTVMMRVADGVNRSMSIASPPQEKTSILVAHDVAPMGPYSKWTINANVGDEMTCIGPLGIFTLDTTSPRKKIFVATGSGIAPFHSMILDFLSPNYQPLTINHELILYWGLRHEEDMFWQEEFTNLEKEHPNFHFILSLSKPQETWTGKVGWVTKYLFQKETDPQNTDFYLCGNRQMIADVKDFLGAKNVPKEQIKSELFY